jgi:PDZ domain-containing protein
VRIAQRPDAGVRGDFLFTTISRREATVFGVLAAAVRPKQRVVANQEVLGTFRRDEYYRRQRQAFLDSTDRAVIVALQAAGLPVRLSGGGVSVVEVLEGTPAEGVLRAGDVITQIDGSAVGTDTELIEAVSTGRTLRLGFRRDGRTRSATVRPERGTADVDRRPIIGVRITTFEPQVDLPFEVDVTSGEVGGPSAGLMIALAVFDLVDDSDLAAGRRIAGTGTLALDGRVGPIDQIELKVLVAARSGAGVFLVPSSQAEVARAAVPASSDMRVIGVDTFADARTVLERPPVDLPDERVASAPCQFSAAA